MEIQKEELDRIIRIKEQIQRDDPRYIDGMMKEIRQYQPFLLSFCGGVIEDTGPAIAGDMAQILLLVWDFFREHRIVREVPQSCSEYSLNQVDLKGIFSPPGTVLSVSG